MVHNVISGNAANSVQVVGDVYGGLDVPSGSAGSGSGDGQVSKAELADHLLRRRQAYAEGDAPGSALVVQELDKLVEKFVL